MIFLLMFVSISVAVRFELMAVGWQSMASLGALGRGEDFLCSDGPR
jgi:hypothetical protein